MNKTKKTNFEEIQEPDELDRLCDDTEKAIKLMDAIDELKRDFNIETARRKLELGSIIWNVALEHTKSDRSKE